MLKMEEDSTVLLLNLSWKISLSEVQQLVRLSIMYVSVPRLDRGSSLHRMELCRPFISSG